MENALLALLGFSGTGCEPAQQVGLGKPAGDAPDASFGELLAHLTSQVAANTAEVPAAVLPALQDLLANAEMAPLELLTYLAQTSLTGKADPTDAELWDAADLEAEQVGGQVSELDEATSDHEFVEAGEEYLLQVSVQPVLVRTDEAQTADGESEPLSRVSQQPDVPGSEQLINSNEQLASSDSEPRLADPSTAVVAEVEMQPGRPDPVAVTRQEPVVHQSRTAQVNAAPELEIQAGKPETQAMPVKSTAQSQGEKLVEVAEPGVKGQEIAKLVDAMHGEVAVTLEKAPRTKPEGRATGRAPSHSPAAEESEEPIAEVSTIAQRRTIGSERLVIGRRGEAVFSVEQPSRPMLQVRSDLPEKPVTSAAEITGGGYEQLVGRDLQIEPASSIRQADAVVTGRFPEVLEDEIVRFSANTAETDAKVIRIKLIPAELGEIQVELRLDEGKVLAQIHTQQASTRDLVYGNLNQLRSALEAQGIQVSNLVVSQAAVSQFAWDGLADRRPQFTQSKREGRKGHDNLPELAIEQQHYHPAQAKWVAANYAGFDLRM